MDERLQAFKHLLDIMDAVRAGCPWDSTQTIHSLRHLTIEETYELSQAILNDDLNEVKKELGDLLLRQDRAGAGRIRHRRRAQRHLREDDCAPPAYLWQRAC